MGNRPRGTPGRLLLIFGVLCLGAAANACWLRGQRESLEWVEQATGLGDPVFFPLRDHSALGPGDDFFEPNLRLAGQAEGHFRRSFNPLEIDDSRVVCVGLESGGRYRVYMRWPWGEGEAGKMRYFLKVADNSYLEFGEQSYDPPEG
jgi:hypothetical protein